MKIILKNGDYFIVHFHSNGQRLMTGRRWKLRYEGTKLNYRFHNPNSAAATADYILKILIQSNAGKVEDAIQKAVIQKKKIVWRMIEW